MTIMFQNQSISSLAILHVCLLKIIQFLINISISLVARIEGRKIKLSVKSGHGLI